jgi:hypothetical protein
MDDPYRMIARHRGFSKYIYNLNNRIVKIKVVLNGEKIKTYSYPDQVRIRSILPKLETGKIYSMNLFYKEEGDYYRWDLKNLIVIQTEHDVDIFKNQNGVLTDPKSDYLLFGYFKKKLIIQEVDMKIYNFHVHSITNEKIIDKGKMMNMNIDFNETICIDANKVLDTEKRIEKILCNYVYDIHQQSERYDEDKGVWDVEVQVMMGGKKNIWKRIWNAISFHK